MVEPVVVVIVLPPEVMVAMSGAVVTGVLDPEAPAEPEALEPVAEAPPEVVFLPPRSM